MLSSFEASIHIEKWIAGSLVRYAIRLQLLQDRINRDAGDAICKEIKNSLRYLFVQIYSFQAQLAESRNSRMFGHPYFFRYCGFFPLFCEFNSKDLVIWKMSAKAGFSAILLSAITRSYCTYQILPFKVIIIV